MAWLAAFFHAGTDDLLSCLVVLMLCQVALGISIFLAIRGLRRSVFQILTVASFCLSHLDAAHRAQNTGPEERS